MAIDSIQPRSAQIKTEDIPLEKIESSKTMTEEQKVAEMTRQFEAVLVRQILSNAQKPAFKSSLIPDGGVSASIYQDMMVNQMADKISSSRTVGLAQQLQQQVTRQVHGKAIAKNESPKVPESPKTNAASGPMTKAPRL